MRKDSSNGSKSRFNYRIIIYFIKDYSWQIISITISFIGLLYNMAQELLQIFFSAVIIILVIYTYEDYTRKIKTPCRIGHAISKNPTEGNSLENDYKKYNRNIYCLFHTYIDKLPEFESNTHNIPWSKLESKLEQKGQKWIAKIKEIYTNNNKIKVCSNCIEKFCISNNIIYDIILGNLPVAFSFALGMVLANSFSSLFYKSSNNTNIKLIYPTLKLENKINNANKFRIIYQTNNSDNNRNLIIITTEDFSSSINNYIEKYKGNYDKSIIYIIEIERSNLYNNVNINDLSENLSKMIEKNLDKPTDITAIGIEAGLAFLLGLKLYKRPEIERILQFSRSTQNFSAAILAKELKNIRKK